MREVEFLLTDFELGSAAVAGCDLCGIFVATEKYLWNAHVHVSTPSMPKPLNRRALSEPAVGTASTAEPAAAARCAQPTAEHSTSARPWAALIRRPIPDSSRHTRRGPSASSSRVRRARGSALLDLATWHQAARGSTLLDLATCSRMALKLHPTPPRLSSRMTPRSSAKRIQQHPGARGARKIHAQHAFDTMRHLGRRNPLSAFDTHHEAFGTTQSVASRHSSSDQ